MTMEKKQYWIGESIDKDKKGVLREKAKKMGLISGDENLSYEDLDKIKKLGGAWEKRANLAITFKKIREINQQKKEAEEKEKREKQEKEIKQCPVGTKIQTLIFNKEFFKNVKSVKNWLKENNFENKFIDEKENTYRVRQVNMSQFEDGSFKTIEITKGVKAVIGCPKKIKKIKI